MASGKKLVEKLRSNRKLVLTWSELCSLLQYLGYEKRTSKKGSSAYRFINLSNQAVIFLHRPHPKKEIADGARDAVVTKLIETGVLDSE